jgi:hypothetical protein
MRYLQDGSHQFQPLMRLSLGLTSLLLLAFWVTNFAMYFSRMGLDPASVVAYYNGLEAEFRPPRSAASMLETTHMHLPMMALVLLLLTHLLLFVPIARRARVVLMVGAFATAALEEVAGWLVRFVSPSFAPLKVVGFVGLQASFGVLIGALGLSLLVARRNGGRNGVPHAAKAPAPNPASEGAPSARPDRADLVSRG